MKKICCLLALLLLLAGCSKPSDAPQTCHIDKNDDGKCDICAEFMLVRLDVYAINDLHGKLTDTDTQPGVDELSTYLKKAQRTGNAIVLSTGDMWQGALESNLTNGLMVTDWMNELSLAAMTLGGHEFDWGEDWIRKNREQAEFPFLAINIYDRMTNQRADYCQSSTVVELEGAQIGIIGAIGNCYYSVASENVKDVYFKTGPELTDLVKKEAETLRSQGVDFIIYAIHDGYDETTPDTKPLSVTERDLAGYYDTSLSDGYVDVVFEADSHYWYLLEDPQGVYHLQAGGNNNGISHATVMLNKANGNADVLVTELIPASRYAYMEDDPIVETLLEKYEAQLAPATRIVGNNGQYRSGYAVCQLVADLYCKAGAERWGAEYDIVLGGGYISCRSPGYLPAGPVSYSQLLSLLPFDNQILLCSIKGSDLIDRFLETENDAYFIKMTDYGKNIRKNIDPDATYYVVTDTYSANYTYNNMTVVDTYDGNTFARDLLAEHIRQGNLE